MHALYVIEDQKKKKGKFVILSKNEQETEIFRNLKKVNFLKRQYIVFK